MLFFLYTLSFEDKKFLEHLYITQRKRMWYIAMHILGDKEKAEDAVQSAFISLISKVSLLKSFYSDSRLSTYVFVVIKNKSLEMLKKEGKHTYVNYDDFEHMISSPENTEDTVITNEEIELLKDEIDKLGTSCREIIYMRSILGLDYKDIADIFNIKVENARCRVSYALKKLKAAVAKKRGGKNE